MDLETIPGKVSNRKYKDIQTVLADVKLIVHNCRTYFAQSNVRTAMAEEMEVAFYHCKVFMPSLIVVLFLWFLMLYLRCRCA
jgi:hypothetical protein